jgi:acyl transferase domain-containing protein
MIAYLLGLQGPAISIDTACSSALTAIHLACEGLWCGTCQTAIAGGTNLMLTPYPFISLSKIQALAKDGRCKSFDASGDGYGRGEGCGMVVLKKLSDAKKNNDPIQAVILFVISDQSRWPIQWSDSSQSLCANSNLSGCSSSGRQSST